MQMLSSLLVSTIIVEMKMECKIMNKQFLGIIKLLSKVMLLLRLGLDTAIMLGWEYLKIISGLASGIVRLQNKGILVLRKHWKDYKVNSISLLKA